VLLYDDGAFYKLRESFAFVHIATCRNPLCGKPADRS
jgi:hypothetical protein